MARDFIKNRLDVVNGYLSYRREKCPLIGIGQKVVIDENSVPEFSWTTLQRQRDEVAKAPLGRVSWLGNKRSYESRPIECRLSMVVVSR